MNKEHIEPCDICGMKYNKEMCKIAIKFFQDDDSCFCKGIKKVQRLINKNKSANSKSTTKKRGSANK